jgi:hypothetical protein
MPSNATPATAVKAAPAVSRLSSVMAALRARIRLAAGDMYSMTVSLAERPQPTL